MTKKLYNGTFSYAGQVFRLFTHAKDERKAYWQMINVLSKRLKVGKRTLMFAFDGSKDNYYIKEVK